MAEEEKTDDKTPDPAKTPDTPPPAPADNSEAVKMQAAAELLKTLGFADTDPEKAKAYLDGVRQKERDALTEDQKRQKDLADKDTALSQAQTRLDTAAASVLRSNIEGAASTLSAEHPEDVVGWVLQNAKRDDLWDEKTFTGKKAAIEAAVKECKKSRPSWFKVQGAQTPGSPSNANGGSPKPDSSKKNEEAKKRQAAAARRGF